MPQDTFLLVSHFYIKNKRILLYYIFQMIKKLTINWVLLVFGCIFHFRLNNLFKNIGHKEILKLKVHKIEVSTNSDVKY